MKCPECNGLGRLYPHSEFNGYVCLNCGGLGAVADVSPDPDPVNHPPHYTSHPSGVECITITEHMPFCVGSAIKYLWRAGLKGDAVEDLRKAAWYIQREIQRREGGKS